MSYQPEEVAEVVDAMVSAMKNKGVVDRNENMEEFSLLTQSGRQDLVNAVANSLGLRVETDPASQLAIYLFPTEAESLFAVTRNDVRKMMMRSVSTTEKAADQCNGIAAQSLIFCYIVHRFFSSDLAPEFVQQDELKLTDLMTEIDKFFTGFERDDGDDFLEPIPVKNAALYYHNRECTTDGTTVENELTRVSTQVGLVKGVLRILEEFGMLDSLALKKSIVKPTRRFACWYGSGLVATSELDGIEGLFKLNGRNF